MIKDPFIPPADTQTTGKLYEMPWEDLLKFDPKTDGDCLMGNRYLGKRGGAVIVAPSGVGKSVLSLQLGACATLGRPFFGLRMVKPMRVLYVQAEDDFGDVAECAQGFFAGYKVTKAERATLIENMRIERWNDAAGNAFLARLRATLERDPFDLVIANPLFSFCGCDVSKQAEMSQFLRNGLNPILNETGAAIVIVHHTNKPKDDQKLKPSEAASDLSYLGSGSAELTNWARAYITLQNVKAAGDGVYKMAFVKRGKRAGIVDANGKTTTSVMIEHSTGPGLCWMPSDYAPNKGTGGKFTPQFSMTRAVAVYDPSLSWKENEQRIADDQRMSTRAVRGYRGSLEAAA